jgi:hypothetical protein
MKPDATSIDRTLNLAANLLRTIEILGSEVLTTNNLDLLPALIATAQTAHDLLDAQGRALGDPGYGWRSPAFRDRGDE